MFVLIFFYVVNPRKETQIALLIWEHSYTYIFHWAESPKVKKTFALTLKKKKKTNSNTISFLPLETPYKTYRWREKTMLKIAVKWLGSMWWLARNLLVLQLRVYIFYTNIKEWV